MIWREFKALGTEIVISASLNNNQKYFLDEAEKETRDFENKFSRFLLNSELSKLNNLSGEWQECSSMMIDILQEVKYYYKITDGIFDPTIAKSLEKIGYDSSFDTIINNSLISKNNEVNKPITTLEKRQSINDINIKNSKVFMPVGMKLDFGGIGKGYLIDYLSKNIFSDIKNYWLSAGGDLIVKGNEPYKIGWKIAVQDPLNLDSDIFSLQTSGEKLAIASSGILRRKGIKNNQNWHHIIDPRNSRPSANGILASTIVARSVTEADVFAKTAIILGGIDGLKFINEQKFTAGILFPASGEPIYSKDIFNYLVDNN